MKKDSAYYAIVLLSVIITSCKKLVEVDPPVTSVSAATAFESNSTAIAAITGIYASMAATQLDGTGATGPGGGITSLSLFPALSADELRITAGLNQSTFVSYYTNSLTVTPPLSLDYWTRFYPVIFSVNAAIAGLNQTAGVTTSVKQQLLGEALFLRAFSYFYLLNLYGDVPLVTGTDYTTNARLARTDQTKVYELVVSDLEEAKNLLSDGYLDVSLLMPGVERVRPTTWAASALLARIYLYLQQWDRAEAEAARVISNSELFSLSSLENAFLKASAGNQEAIWQLQPVVVGWNTQDARKFILPVTGPTITTLYPVFLNDPLLNAFEQGDNRYMVWIDSVAVNGSRFYYPHKYKSATFDAEITEYQMVLRLAEQYLIRAEARAHLNNITGAQEDLNAVRMRAGLSATTANTTEDLLSAILHERQVELFTEWGHRWLDLKRTGLVDQVMSDLTPIKGGLWEPFDQLYPIPLIEIQLNGALVQNPGY